MAKKDLIKNLTVEQKKFCERYVTAEFFCNWTESYLKTYSMDRSKYKIASTNASKLLSQVKIMAYIDSLIEFAGLNDQFVDKQLMKLLTQDWDKKTKLWAIKEYNILKVRVEKAKQRALNEWEITETVITNIVIT